jgi:hypothetical protein
MFSWRWLALSGNVHKRHDKKQRRTNSFRPRVGELEDRLTPSGFGGGVESFLGSHSGPATHLHVATPGSVHAGDSFDVVVAAETASNRIATGYTGTIHFSLGTSDAGASLPADYTFLPKDHGIHVFHVTLGAVGDQTIAATDTTTSTITGSAALTITPAAEATQFLVHLPEHVVPGVPVNVTVVAADASKHIVKGYTGTVHFTSTDGAAALPSDYTFTAADHGKHTFKVTFGTTGAQSVTAADTATGSTVAGTGKTTVETVGEVTHFGVFSFGGALAGFATPVVVVALDASNHIVANYVGTVHITSSDGAATLPADYTFTASDHGRHVFSVTFATPGKQTVTATDSTTGVVAITGTTKVRVFADLGGGGD